MIRRLSTLAMALFASLVVAACQESSVRSEPSRRIGARVVQSSRVPAEIWEATRSIRIVATTSQGWVLFQQVVPFADHRTPEIAAPSDQAVQFEISGMDSAGMILWVGKASVAASNTDQTLDIQIDIPIETPAPDGIYLGRTESVEIEADPTSDPEVYLPTSEGVRLRSPSYAATIHYTLDGTWPTLQSPIYTGPILDIPPGSVRLRALAFAPRMLPSEVRSFWIGSRGLGKVVRIGADPMWADTFSIKLSTTAGEIHFTTDGSAPTWDSPRTDSLVKVDRDFLLRAAAFVGPERISEEFVDTVFLRHRLEIYPFLWNGQPTANYVISSNIPGTTIHCTYDGRDPTLQDEVFPRPDFTGIQPILPGMKFRGWRQDIGWTPIAQRADSTATPLFQPQISILLDSLFINQGVAPLLSWTLDGSAPPFGNMEPVAWRGLSTLGLDQGDQVRIRAATWSADGRKLGEAEFLYFRSQGTMTDPRDGKTYATKKLGPGKATWMVENLRYDTLWRDKSWTQPRTVWRVYDRSLVVDSLPCQASEDAQDQCVHLVPRAGLCPTGWHLPTTAEWNDALASGLDPGQGGWFLPESDRAADPRPGILGGYWSAEGDRVEVACGDAEDGCGVFLPDQPAPEREARPVRCVRDQF